MKEVILYSDGACSGNPGPGGWGTVLIYGEHQLELSGYEANTTNNRMEITAVIKGLEALNQPCKVTVNSDSAYVVNTFDKKWIYGWLKRNWVKSDGNPVENIDLWQKLLTLTRKHDVTFHKVKGHANNQLNNRCDELATSEVRKHAGNR